MMCHRMGRPPISTIGFGRNSVSSRSRVPNPPHNTMTFIQVLRGWRVSVARDHLASQNFSSVRRDRSARLPQIAACKSAHVIVGQKWFATPRPAVSLFPYRVAVIDQHDIDAIRSADAVEIGA